MKNLLKTLLIYIIIIVPIVSFYLSINTQYEKVISLTQKELAGVEYLHAIYKFNVALAFYKEHLSTNATDKELAYKHKQMQERLNDIYTLSKKYPEFNSQKLRKRFEKLKNSDYANKEYYEFLSFINNENYRIGDISTLLFEKDRKIYFLNALITHYLPEYLISNLIVHTQIEKFIIHNKLTASEQNVYIEQNKLIYLSVQELHEIIELLRPYKESKTLIKLIYQTLSILDDFTHNVKASENWKKNDPKLEKHLITSYKLLDLAFKLTDENIRLLTLQLKQRLEVTKADILKTKLILLALISLLTALAFYLFHTYNSNLKKDKQLKAINQTLDKFVMFSKTDKQGRIIYTSSALEKLSGYTKKELLGQKHSIFRHEDMPDSLFKEMWESILEKNEWRGEIKNRRKDGSSYWVKLIITPELDNNDEIISFNGYREDISNQKELEQEKHRTQQALKFKSMFLSNMSHEIRTPLNGIIGFTHLALQNKLEPKVKEIISSIKSASELLLGIINDILDISKIESGKMSIENIPFDLKETIENIQRLLEQKAKEKALKFEVDYGNVSNFNLIGDPLKLSQILTNLLSNAIKFTEKGHVSLCLEQLQDKSIKFSVIDTGIGLKDSQVKNLFQEFTQADMSTSRKYGGTGLGLAISKRLTQMMGGKLKVSSHYGKGSTFSFILCLPEASKETMKSLPQESQTIQELEKQLRGLKDINILVAEDNKMNQMLLSMLLENTDIHLEFAKDGEIAVKMAEENHYNLILMDIQMPNMNGYEACTAIRKRDKEIPIIALSANVMQDDIQASLVVGMNAHIAKPIELDKLYRCLIKYLLPQESDFS